MCVRVLRGVSARVPLDAHDRGVKPRRPLVGGSCAHLVALVEGAVGLEPTADLARTLVTLSVAFSTGSRLQPPSVMFGRHCSSTTSSSRTHAATAAPPPFPSCLMARGGQDTGGGLGVVSSVSAYRPRPFRSGGFERELASARFELR